MWKSSVHIEETRKCTGLCGCAGLCRAAFLQVMLFGFLCSPCTREGVRFSGRVECLVLGRPALCEGLVWTTKMVPEKYEP